MPGGSSALHVNLHQVKHDIGNTAYALKLAVQMLSDSRGDASLVDKVAKGLDSEARSLDQLMASLERAIDRVNT